ncbi:glycosyltransferase, partial [Methanosphaera sp.]|uniref:glycosyltransferase n=1 Tax=Methanosphaera sp. TaxID=2666342 RepID=UPI002E7A646B
MYKISIIVSLLDSEKDIMDIVNSFLSQTFDFNELDIIFVYNNSDNFTGSIIKSLLKWYPNISEYKVTSNNKWDAYSVGLKNATADYVLFINENYNLFDYTFKSLFNLIS